MRHLEEVLSELLKAYFRKREVLQTLELVIEILPTVERQNGDMSALI
ncbi:hypothetical protein PAAL109150_01800 [Paenibacillus alkaliterrae]